MKLQILALILICLVVTAATDTDQLALDVANAQKANQAAITKYSWHVKADLAMDGVSKANVINEVRFNTEGKLETTVVGGESHVEKKRGMRGRQQEKKMDEFADYLAGVIRFEKIFCPRTFAVLG